MNLSAQFKAYLLSQKHPASKATVKNYLSDVNRFISWFEAKFSRKFLPEEVNLEIIEAFKSESLTSRSASSVERSLSTLRKFFTFLSLEGIISQSPFKASSSENDFDPWKLIEFRNYLFVLNSSPLTIKNYITDIKQFKSWLEDTIPPSQRTDRNISELIYNIDSRLIGDYKCRLLDILRLSPTSVNRKLSSLRSYCSWAREHKLIKPDSDIDVANESESNMPLVIPVSQVTEPKPSSKKTKKSYSSFPPFRLIQKTGLGMMLAFDALIIAPLALLLTQADKIIWIAKGRPVFEAETLKNPAFNILEPLQAPTGPVKNIPKSYYAPTHISVASFPAYKKVWYHLRYTRPQWYRKYHSYTFVSYLHFSILLLIVTIFGYMIFLKQDSKTNSEAVLAALPVVANRNLSFQGRLTDAQGTPIDSSTNLRMSIYDSEDATGSALLWQEVVSAAPDSDGIFNVLLGENTPIPQSLFATNPALWLGVTVETTSELTPRQPIATVAYAVNAETLQGLPPITNSTRTSNVVLALNSSGNLTIGGSASHIFRVTGGNFTLTGQTLTLSTNTGSNGNVTIVPDGSGVIDIQKAITNTSGNNSIIPGAVQIDDILVVNGSTDGETILNINQASTGDLIVASVSGESRFSVDNGGNITANGSFNGFSVTSGTVTSGTWQAAIISSTYGGTGINSSSSTGVPFISSGTWSVDSNSLAANHGGTGLTSYTAGDIIYATSSGGLATLGIGGNGNCLVSNGSAPTWGSCGVATSDLAWGENLGAVFPVNSTQDFFIGGTSTASAEFAILNVNEARGNQIASLSGSITLDSDSATIQTVNNQALALGGGSTGKVQVNNVLGGTFTTFDTLNSSVGIGTSFPSSVLHVTRPLSFGATGQALVILDQTEDQDILAASVSGSTVFRVANDGTVELNLATAGTTNDAVCWDGSGSTLLYDCDSTPADYAESYPVAKNVEYGDIVMTTDVTIRTKIGTNVPILTKAVNHNSSRILGVTSDNWHDFTSAGKEEIDKQFNPLPIALNGRVITKVTSENGDIKIGDPITASKIPGVGMKSTKTETIVGTALENYSSSNPDEIGQILVFINPGQHSPAIMFASNLDGLTLSEGNNEYEILNKDFTIDNVASYSELLVARLKAGYLELGKLTVNSAQIAFASFGEISTEALAVSTENITIAGNSLSDYIMGIVDTRLREQQIAISSPILETDIIKPGRGNKIAIKLPTNESDSSFEIRNSSGSAVASIDAQGNIEASSASLSGSLTSSRIQTTDASVSGTLRADRIVADQIDLSDNALSVLQNSISSTPAITNNYYYSSYNDDQAKTASSGTGSATLASITAGVGTFTNGLISFGDTSFYDANVANRLFVGAQLSIADKSINVLGSDLRIQPLGLGGVDFLDGKMVIDSSGNLNVNGNAYFAKDVDINGKLSAGIISVESERGLVFEFKDEEDSNVEFKTGSGSAVLSFNSKGDINSSGAGTFNKLNLNIIPEAIAVSDTEIIATGSAGTAEIKAYKNELTINNPLVTKDSLIYITPKTSVANQSIYLLRQVEGESFTVGLSKVVGKSVPFNWILIN